MIAFITRASKLHPFGPSFNVTELVEADLPPQNAERAALKLMAARMSFEVACLPSGLTRLTTPRDGRAIKILENYT